MRYRLEGVPVKGMRKDCAVQSGRNRLTFIRHLMRKKRWQSLVFVKKV